MLSFSPKHLKNILHRLEAVFKKISNAGLKLKPSKCEFFKKRIHYLGHIVSNKGIETDPKKIEAIVNWPGPHTVHEVEKKFWVLPITTENLCISMPK